MYITGLLILFVSNTHAIMMLDNNTLLLFGGYGTPKRLTYGMFRL